MLSFADFGRVCFRGPGYLYATTRNVPQQKTGTNPVTASSQSLGTFCQEGVSGAGLVWYQDRMNCRLHRLRTRLAEGVTRQCKHVEDMRIGFVLLTFCATQTYANATGDELDETISPGLLHSLIRLRLVSAKRVVKVRSPSTAPLFNFRHGAALAPM